MVADEVHIAPQLARKTSKLGCAVQAVVQARKERIFQRNFPAPAVEKLLGSVENIRQGISAGCGHYFCPQRVVWRVERDSQGYWQVLVGEFCDALWQAYGGERDSPG